MVEKKPRHVRYLMFIACGLALCLAWNVVKVLAWPQWIEVKNDSQVAAKDVRLEVWDQGGRLVSDKRWSKLSSGWTVAHRLSQQSVTARLSYTLDFGHASYHERRRICSSNEGWRFRIEPTGVVFSRNVDADGSLRDFFFGRVY